jgi:Fic family protein
MTCHLLSTYNSIVRLQIIPTDLVSAFAAAMSPQLQEAFDALQEAAISTVDFSFYTSVASVYSSKIEGEDIALDSYIKHKHLGITFLPDYTQKTDDLYDAYQFAKQHTPNEANGKAAHTQLAKHLLPAHAWGTYRTQNMFVATPDGRIEYIAAAPSDVPTEMHKLWADIAVLLQQPLQINEVFYYASMIHLLFVKIHPWQDGNGRTARLLEKWFLAHHLGPKAWFMQSEKYYYQHHSTYYHNLRLLGIEYDTLNYEKALPFCNMLAESLICDF